MLDTNVIAELMRPRPEPQVLTWADRLAPGTAGLTTMSEAEILHGLARLPEGRRREALQRSREALLPALFHERVLASIEKPRIGTRSYSGSGNTWAGR